MAENFHNKYYIINPNNSKMKNIGWNIAVTQDGHCFIKK